MALPHSAPNYIYLFAADNLNFYLQKFRESGCTETNSVPLACKAAFSMLLFLYTLFWCSVVPAPARRRRDDGYSKIRLYLREKVRS